MNCHKCKHRRDIPGDAHSRCLHPAIGEMDSNPFGALVDMLDGRWQKAAIELNIKADPHGVREGWFMWPANFDPVWLLNCDGFEERTAGKR